MSACYRRNKFTHWFSRLGLGEQLQKPHIFIGTTLVSCRFSLKTVAWTQAWTGQCTFLPGWVACLQPLSSSWRNSTQSMPTLQCAKGKSVHMAHSMVSVNVRPHYPKVDVGHLDLKSTWVRTAVGRKMGGITMDLPWIYHTLDNRNGELWESMGFGAPNFETHGFMESAFQDGMPYSLQETDDSYHEIDVGLHPETARYVWIWDMSWYIQESKVIKMVVYQWRDWILDESDGHRFRGACHILG